MKLEISGKHISRKDLVEILTFFRKKWSTEKRSDILNIIVKEGTENDSIEELMELMNSVFQGRENWTEILRIKEKK